jgi:hypothetical protein
MTADLDGKVAPVAGATRGCGRAIAVERIAIGLTAELDGQPCTALALAADPGAGRHAGQSLTSGQLARVYGFTDTDGSRPDCWAYVTEIEDPGRPARETGYR